MHIIENLRIDFTRSCPQAKSVAPPKDNGMITNWVWALLITILAQGDSGKRARNSE